MCLCWVFNIFFLLYRGEPRENVYQKEKLEHLKATKFHLAYYNQQPTNETQPFKDIIQGISTMYHWRLETRLHVKGTHIKEEPPHVINA